MQTPQSLSNHMKYEKPQCSPGGANYLLVKFGDDMSLELNFLTLGLDKALAESGNSYIIDTVACYNSLLIEPLAKLLGVDNRRRGSRQRLTDKSRPENRR